MRISDWSSDVCSSDLHVFEVMNCNLAHFVAARFGRTAQVEKCPHLFRRKTQLARPLDEFERAEMTVVENPVSPCCAIRRTEHSDLLEVPDCLEMDARFACPFTYRKAAHADSP